MAMSFAILLGVIVREQSQSGRAAAFADVERSAWARLAWIGGSRRFRVRVCRGGSGGAHEGKAGRANALGGQRVRCTADSDGSEGDALYQGMREQGIGKAELARRLGWRLTQVDRVLDVEHRSRMDRMEAALGAIGKRLVVQVKADSQAAL